jgi:hypothetical protein
MCYVCGSHAYTCDPVHRRCITWLCISHDPHAVAPSIQAAGKCPPATVVTANLQHLCQGGLAYMQALWLCSVD